MNPGSEWLLYLKGSAKEMIFHNILETEEEKGGKEVDRQFQVHGLWPKRPGCFAIAFNLIYFGHMASPYV